MSTAPAGPRPRVLHGSAVAVADRAVLILGQPGSGKTTLALQMIALGAQLVADDQVTVAARDKAVLLDAPQGLSGIAEIRGFGLIRLPAAGPVPLALIADLDRRETDRMPDRADRARTAQPGLPEGLPPSDAPVMLCKDRAGLASVLTCILRAAEWPDPQTFSLHRPAD